MPDLRPEFFRRIDESDDELFYQSPRLVTHIDDGAIAKAREIYARFLPADGEILDLMSSWRSHLPASLNPRRVVGLGLNHAEMADNPALTEIVVHNVNRDPQAALRRCIVRRRGDDGLGAISHAADRGLSPKPDGCCNRARLSSSRSPIGCFRPRRSRYGNRRVRTQRVTIVESYFARSGAFDNVQIIDRSGPGDGRGRPIRLWAVTGLAKHPDKQRGPCSPRLLAGLTGRYGCAIVKADRVLRNGNG